ncbi:cold-shock protein [Methylocapsa polymorpha]|uniref:cold-shock protein n=1 Tax=Methylocapsa polymorpha TaxID=3080828 RepID=UPI00388FD004
MDDKNPASLRLDFGVHAPRIEALELVEISGQVKWFDSGKGYGFIVPENGGPDVLLHIATLRKDGFHTASEGAHVVCEAVRRAKGFQVLKVLSMDGPTAAHPAEWQSPRTHAHVASAGGFEIVVVKWFNRARGFGFLTRGDGTQDIFIHMETLRHYGIGELRPGESLLARFGDGPKGLMAAEVRLLNAVLPVSH